MQDRPTERQLTEAAQNGDRKAFGQLIRMHQQRLTRMAIGLVGSFDVAEDIVQETFVRAYGAIRRFRTEYAFYPWLATIARNLAYNHLYREEKKESLDALQEKGFDPRSADLGPLDKLLNGEAQKRFFEAVQALPVQYRAVFVLRHFEKMDYTQIAGYLKIPVGTVDSRLYRARQLLLAALKDLM
ncbi:MAG TPA: sigma-70 family RNA polymerase sigma factor [Candidatus Deferrimicrobium sp.]|nr:sigma-70 family RNA polymerase sigma factor [Candidatus Deferrimicrobium sp.]